LAAAAAVARLLSLDDKQTLHALGSAGTQAAGLWEFLRDAADSKQLHTAKAAADGLLSAHLAQSGFTGATLILEGEQGMAAGMSSDSDPSRLVDRLGSRWAVTETSFKFHACCRHTHPAADALLKLMRQHGLKADDIVRVQARVHQGAIDVLGTVTDPQTIHQSKFSMGFVLALIALHGRAGLEEFTEEALHDPAVRAFHDRVKMVLDEEVDSYYPRQWIGHVTVETRAGDHIVMTIPVPKGDPGHTLSRAELENKAHRLAAYQQGATTEEMARIIGRIWRLTEETDVTNLLSPRSPC
jgi:2-methylcitrate dehydratase PrpD